MQPSGACVSSRASLVCGSSSPLEQLGKDEQREYLSKAERS